MSNHPSPPNLFHYGQKELSQDAMICWLLVWANKEYAGVNSKLHEVGNKFARALLSRHENFVPEEISKVVVEKQVSGIDVLVTVNEKITILIEDKTDSSRHGNQLVRYHNIILERGVTKDNFFPIFLKTGNMSKGEKETIENGLLVGNSEEPLDPPYRVFNRADFIEALSEAEGVSEILDDFVCYLKELEDDFNSWNPKHKACKHPKNWTRWGAWQGFYRSLENQFEVAGWGYVPNQTGGFLGLWWLFNTFEWGSVYLQIEEKHVAFKIEVRDVSSDSRRERRNYWHHKVIESAEKSGIRIVKPERFGNGRTMTVAVYNSDVDSNENLEWRVVGNDKLDYEATIEVLKSLEEVLCSAVESYKGEVPSQSTP